MGLTVATFSFPFKPTDDDIWAAVGGLRSTGYRYLFGIIFGPEHFDMVMEEAYRQGALLGVPTCQRFGYLEVGCSGMCRTQDKFGRKIESYGGCLVGSGMNHVPYIATLAFSMLEHYCLPIFRHTELVRSVQSLVNRDTLAYQWPLCCRRG
mmetsp:Transcript_28807/g.63982  ORF Transcript_28807/g.63982 Transcript_28807/m.63982 type:complete len:151 (+) Transcript_28807:291-743(+)